MLRLGLGCRAEGVLLAGVNSQMLRKEIKSFFAGEGVFSGKNFDPEIVFSFSYLVGSSYDSVGCSRRVEIKAGIGGAAFYDKGAGCDSCHDITYIGVFVEIGYEL